MRRLSDDDILKQHFAGATCPVCQGATFYQEPDDTEVMDCLDCVRLYEMLDAFTRDKWGGVNRDQNGEEIPF